jgi:hypothetical protein
MAVDIQAGGGRIISWESEGAEEFRHRDLPASPGVPSHANMMEEQNKTFSLCGRTFHGAYASPAALASMPGVYVIWCESKTASKVIDVGESDDVRKRMVNHERAVCWERNCRGFIRYCAFYTSGETEAERKLLAEEIRKTARPPCGEDAPSGEPDCPVSPTHDTGI